MFAYIRARIGLSTIDPRRWTVFCAFLAALALMTPGIARANQTPSTSAGTSPVTKTYPSGLTSTISVGGARVTIATPSTALNTVGGITSALMSPAISATTNASQINVDSIACPVATFRCVNQGSLTITFNRAVTDPVIHLSGLGGNTGGTTTMYHAALIMSSWSATGTPTLTRLNGNTNFSVSGSEIRATSVTGGTSCTAAVRAGCGSVRINGTVTSVTFQVDILMGGTANPNNTGGAPIDAFTVTASVDEDFGDAPGGFDPTAAASHIVGSVFMGSAPTADNIATTNPGTITPSPLASANASTDTDNGVTIPTLIRGQAANIDVAVTGTGGRLQGWIDWGDDGSWATAGDQIATNAIDGGAGDADGVANGVIRLAITVPAGAAITETIARFRYATATGLAATGLTSDGEVEDYAFTVLPLRNDLSLTKTVSNASPANGSSINYVLTVTSAASPASTATATGITVQDTLPAGVSFVSASGTGTYTSGTGVWAVGSLAPGASASITITATVTAASGTVTNIALISASSLTDPDSTVNNGVTTEDDYASVPFTVASILPAPVCPVGVTNQIIANGNFSTGTGPSWPSWTAGSVWFGTTDANVDNNTVSGSLAQSGLSGLKIGPSVAGGSVVQLSAWWRNGAPAAGSTTSQLRVLVAGTEYARITTDPSAGASATVTYFNGASGNLTTITEFNSTGWRINVPTTVANTGSISFDFVPGGGAAADDFMVDNVTLYTCTIIADLSLTKTVSNPTPNLGDAISYTLTVTNAAASNATASGITVQDTLPAGFTFTSATGVGTYDSGTGVWTVGSLAPNTNAALTINGTVNSSVTGGVAVTNIAQVSASSAPDPDSTVNNNVTTEDDYASVPFTVPAVYNCPVGNTGTGSGFAVGGTGAHQNQIFWLDWSCGGVGGYPIGATINKSWDAGDGLIITGQVTNVTAAMTTYATGTYGGDILHNMYTGVNPIGLRGFTDGEDPQFRLNFSASVNGTAVPLNYVAADAESTDGANEALAGTVSGGTNWSLLDQSGALTVNLAGASFTMSDVANAGLGSAVVSTTGLTPQIDATITQGGLQAMAFGVFTPFDYSDAPLTGTSYASANHRTISTFDLGAAFTTEGAAYDSPTATGDVDDGVTLPASMTAGVPVTMTVAAPNAGHLSAWFDWNDDGDFADAGEQVATDIVNGGAGDTDGAANGVITFNVTPTTGTAQTFARFRLSSRTGAPSSGLWGFGEIEDYQIVILNKAVLTLVKSNTVWNDGVNPLFHLPGNDVVYSLTAANTTNGQPDANSVFLYDSLPAQLTFFNGDADGAGAGTNPVNFIDSGSGLTFNYATDVAYSNAASPPANFAACTYTPTAGYDVNVKYVCFNPKGTMAANTGSGSPAFTFSFRTRIK